MHELAALFIKPQRGAAMRRVTSVTGIAGVGIVGDCNAHAASPRQVLLVAARDLRDLRVGGADLRANLVVRGDLCGLRSGSIISFGKLALRITMSCEPCGQLNDVRPGLSKDIGSKRGLLARVVVGGSASIGTEGRLLGTDAGPLPDDWRERVFAILMTMPAGRVLSYTALARAAGVQTAYCRAIPSVLRKLEKRGAPVHRVVPNDVSSVDVRIARKLKSEGIDLRSDTSTRAWDASCYYAEQERHLLSGLGRRKSLPSGPGTACSLGV